MQQSSSIGIDFGTTKSAVGVKIEQKVEIVQNEQGAICTPSCVAFTDSTLVVGSAALDQITANIDNTVVGIKRVLGREFGSHALDTYLKDSCVKIVKGKDKLPKFEVELMKTKRQFCPEETSSFIISKLKDIAENYLKVNGCPTTVVKHVAIAVPLFFTGSQRQAVKDAATIAGMKANLISEPIAAAIAYGICSKNIGEKRNVLVFDIGGGKAEATVLTIEGRERTENYSVYGTAYNCAGGCAIDNILIEYFKSQLNVKLKTKRDSERLRKACESVKHRLSLLKHAKVDTYVDGKEYTIELTRTKFEGMCDTLFMDATLLVKQALDIAQMKSSQIDELILIGGCTRIPMIREMFYKRFPGKVAVETLNPDEVIACGAAAYLEGSQSERRITVSEMLSKPIRISSEKSFITSSKPGKKETLIRVNTLKLMTRIPAEIKMEFDMHDDLKDRVKVCQHENNQPGKCEWSNTFCLLGRDRYTSVLVRIDKDRRLTICQLGVSDEECKRLPLIKSEGISRKEVQRMASQQQVERNLCSSRKALECSVYDLQGKIETLSDDGKKLLEATRDFLDSRCSIHATKEIFENRRNEVLRLLPKGGTSNPTVSPKSNKQGDGPEEPTAVESERSQKSSKQMDGSEKPKKIESQPTTSSADEQCSPKSNKQGDGPEEPKAVDSQRSQKSSKQMDGSEKPKKIESQPTTSSADEQCSPKSNKQGDGPEEPKAVESQRSQKSSKQMDEKPKKTESQPMTSSADEQRSPKSNKQGDGPEELKAIESQAMTLSADEQRPHLKATEETPYEIWMKKKKTHVVHGTVQFFENIHTINTQDVKKWSK